MNAGAIWRYVKHSVRQYGRDNCPQLAAAISYYVLFSVVPLTFVLVSVFGLIIREESLRSDVVQQVADSIGLEKGDVSISLVDEKLERFTPGQIAQLRQALDRLTPAERQTLADQLVEKGRATLNGIAVERREVEIRYDNAISDTLSAVAGASAPFTVFSLLASAWSASAMFGAVRKALNIVWKVEYHRPYLQQKAWDLLMVAAFGLLLLVSVAGTGALRTLRETSDEALGPLSTGTGLFWGILPYVLPGLVSLIVFAALYRLVPAMSVRLRDVWLGALVAAVLFEALKNGFAFYVTNFKSYDLLYGSLGGILLFLTGVYFASAILLLGGELAAAMPGLRAGVFAGVPEPSKPKVALREQARREVVAFLRGLVLPPRRKESDSENRHTRPDRAPR